MMIKDKLTMVNDSLTIYRYDNGYMVEVGGRDSKDDWKNARISVSSINEAIDLVTEFSELPINE